MPVLPRINRNLDNPTRPSVKTRSLRNTQGNTPQPERADASHWMLNEAVGTSLVLIDPAVSNLDLLVDGVLPGVEVRVLAGDRDGITQITEILQTWSSIDRLHIVAHGSPGCLYLGNARLDRATLAHYAPALQRWSKALSPKAAIALYGCSLGADADHSPSLLGQLHQLTRRAIAASSTPIGDAALGGNWELDVAVGDRPLSDYSALPFLAFTPEALQAYPGIFTTYTVTNTNDSGAGSLRQAIMDANGNPGPDLIAFDILGTAPFTINLASALPAIIDPVTIDATTQTGYVDAPVIEINGSSAGASANGFSVEFASGVTLRGFAINGFDGAGVNLSYSSNVLIEGNYIGTSLDGTTAIANGIGIQILGSGSFDNTIGGITDAARNVISGNTNEGVLISGGSGTTVVGNYIGTAADGTTSLGNGGSGVATLFGPGSTIGGTGAGEGNTIAYNGGNGVGVQNSGTTISGNSIFGNTGLGVDLGSNGVTANDAGDGDTGANSLQNFPVFSSVTKTNIAGNFNSTASTNFQIEYFASATADGSGNGEGQVFLGSQTVTTDGSGNVNFNFGYTFDPTKPFVTATATNTTTFNTSEFSAAGTAAFVVTNTNDSGAGSLRQAIIDANGAAGADYIIFNIPGSGPHTINLTSALPNVTGQVSLDGTTQPGFAGSPQIVLNGAAIATPGSVGLILASGSDSSTVRGLVIQNFPSNGMRIDSSGNTIAGNYIGTNADGTAAAANGFHGIVLFNSSNNTIGGTTAADRNVISGNAQSGISGSGSNNAIVGNYIGTNAAGTGTIGNSQHGINLAIAGSNNTIGGTTTGARNVISGNAQNGINFGGTNSNAILGNYIGVDATGTVDLGNGQAGVFVSAFSSNNSIGGAAAGAGNVISGNNTTGISILSTNNAVRGNYIGTNATGTADVGNTQDGVYIESAFNTVGGTTAGERNVISGNNNAGIRMTGNIGISNTIQGNYIGTDAAGTGAIANSTGGIAIVNSASNNTIGGTASGAGNVISGNNGAGVDISDLASGNTVQGNLIGTDAAGILALGNSDAGVGILNATNNQIGGSTPESRNIISGNTGSGVLITDGSLGNQIQGNYIGADITGTGAIANTGDGVLLGDTASNNLIGGTAAGAGNLISGNNGDGVETLLTSGTGNAISRNSIVGNGQLGIDLGGDGITPNDLDDIDTGANNLQNFPVIDTVTVVGGNTIINGTFTGAANTTFDVELFSNTATDPSGNGEGQTYLTTISVTTDGSGVGTINETLVGVDLTGLFVAATATDLSGNTSEFSGAIEALSGGDPLIVTNTSDNGVGSLRAAIAFANSNPGSDTITFDTTSGVFADATPDTILLTSGGFEIIDSVTITGLGADLLTIQRDSGASSFRLFTIDDGTAAQVTIGISGFNLSGGIVEDDNGGAIFSRENLVISDSIIRDNGTISSGFGTGYGGAIWHEDANLTIINSLIEQNAGFEGGAIWSSGGTVNIERSQIFDNVAFLAGGGIYNTSGNLNISLSTISNNSVTTSLGAGGGIWHSAGNLLVEASTIDNNSANEFGGGIYTSTGSDSATIRSSTISGNTVGNVFGIGGGLFNAGGLTIIENSTITDNQALTGIGGGVALDIDGAASVEVTSSIIAGNNGSDVEVISGSDNFFFSNGNNLIGTGDGLADTGNGSGFTQPTDTTGVTDPGLNPLANNGGPTQTHSLTNSSLARDAGNVNGQTRDQRGAPRVLGSSADIGAFEAPEVESDPLIVTNTNDSGIGSLREAIAFANGNPGADTITFDIPTSDPGYNSTTGAYTISLLSGLPEITEAITIDGTSQTGFPGSPIIVLEGALAGDTSGLVLAPGSDGSFIQSLVINNFQSSGRSGISIVSSNNTIQGNYIGTDVSGTVAAGNNTGITLFSTATNNLIGGTGVEERNLISGNTEEGIYVLAADSNIVQGNYIGTDITGTAVLGNGTFGIQLITGASGNTIGGGASGAGNIISGNSLGGISVAGADTTTIQANIIGTDFGRTLDLGNGSFGGGISLSDGAFNNTIGGPLLSLGNTVAFNDGDGISSNPFSPAGTGNALSSNSIFSNTELGIDLGDDGITPNDLGDADTGSNNLQNFAVLTGASVASGITSIGGTLNSEANTTFRIEFFTSAAADPSGNGEGQNSIGFVDVTTDASGNVTFNEIFGADYSGSLIATTVTNLTTNDTSEFSNALTVSSALVVTNTNDSGAGSLRAAIAFANSNPGADTITFNIAGGGAQTINLLSALPSITGSVTIDGTTQPGYTNTPLITLNGSGAGFASTGLNLFSGNNTIKGLEITRFNRGIGISSSNNTIQGNSLILNTFGISVDAGTNNQIGGTTAGAGNVISANFSTGLAIDTSDTTVQGNQIQGNPVGIVLSGANNTIGGEAAGAGNVITNSQDDGITIIGTGSTGNLISRNSIHNNGSIPTTDDLGIDLGGDGITANDSGDGDVGPNGLQNAPVITAATLDGSTTRLAGTFNSTPNTTFRLEFFSDSAPNLIGTWEGETFLGAVDVTTDASGNATFNPSFATAVPLGQGITATARNLTNNDTSEFSAASIVTDIPTVSISPLEITQAEGNSVTTAYVYTVTLSNASATPVTVNYSTNNGTATTADGDYLDNDGALTFNPGGPLTQTITVLVNGDTVFEGAEDFTVTLDSVVNATLGTSSATGTITNDDALPAISISDVTLAEGNSGGTNAVFTVSLSNPSSQTVTVDYATANNTAIAGSDYVGISTTTLTFAPGETSKTVNVTVNGDTITEGNETFTVNLSGATNATLADGQGLGIITNDDGVPTVSISPASITQLEGNSVTTAYVYTVTLSNASATPVTVNYSTNNGTATTADGDYLDNDGALTFNPGDPLTQTITVLVNGDTVFEGAEDFTVTLDSAVNASLGTSSATGTITNDDALPAISISDVTLAEGNSSTTNAVFTVSLSNPSSQTVTVNYATANNTAIAGSDYVGIPSTTLTFAPGETSKIVNVTVNGDTTTEGNETFTVNLSGATNATLADGQGLGIITNDDGVPTVSISPASITQLEGNSSTTAYVYTVTLSNASATPVTVNYSTNNGTATTADGDYVDNDGALVFNPGDPLTQTITILVNGDTAVEGDENFAVQLNSAVNAVVGTNTATGTITNDDTAQASFSLSQILTDGDGAVFNGRATGDFAGGVASNAGDLNNDGFDDIFIAARKADPSGRTDAGEAYVLFGNATGAFPSSPDALNGSNGFRLEGIARFDGNGFSGQSAGDINGDGFDDLILGARSADANGKSDSGQAYVIFGKASGFTSSISLSTLNGTNGFRINGEKQYDNAGHSVSGIGDIDGDGLDDIAVSAVGSDPSGRSNAGQVYVLFGNRAGFGSSFNLTALPTTGGNSTGFRLSGLVAGDSLGYSLSRAGDINNDNIDDFIVGATGADPNGSNSGQAYVVFGNAGLKTSGFSNLAILNGSNGFRVSGVAANDSAGLAITRIGDMNNDGIDDIAIASPNADASNTNAGAVYVVFGKTGGFASNLNLSSLDGSNGFRLTGIDADDLTGLALSSAGDFNEDGIDDLLIGAPYADPSGTSSGEAYVVYGNSSFASSISLASLNGSNGLTITGITANSLTGFSVGSGNFNGNAGLLLGAPNSGNGAAYAIFNSILS